MTNQTINVPLTTSQIRFLMDMVIVCHLDNVRKSMVLHDVNDAAVYDQLWNCLPEGDRPY
jgi:hypothetical protein